MDVTFPSPEFTNAVAAVCHGSAAEGEMRALNELLRGDPRAREEYLFQVELHSRLASTPDLFSQVGDVSVSLSLAAMKAGNRDHVVPLKPIDAVRRPGLVRVLALAACLMLITVGIRTLWVKRSSARTAWNEQ